MSQKISSFLSAKKRIIEAELQRYLRQKTAAPRLNQAMHYAVLNGGKRIRPILMLGVTELLNGSVRQILPVACAIEMIHSYSLVHDDLPAMDDDDLRRGKPTCHKKFDEATAILAGDTLQAYAYEVLVKGSLKTKIPMEKILELVEDLGNASGFNGMAGGQMIDLQSEKAKTSLKELIRLHQLKTGCLLKFSIAAPAVVYGVDRRTKNILEQYADIIGLAFQIKDDILDVEGTAEELGKTPGKDSLEEKATFVKLLGLEKAKKYLIEEINKALAVAIYFGEGNILMDFAEYLLERKN